MSFYGQVNWPTGPQDDRLSRMKRLLGEEVPDDKNFIFTNDASQPWIRKVGRIAGQNKVEYGNHQDRPNDPNKPYSHQTKDGYTYNSRSNNIADFSNPASALKAIDKARDGQTDAVLQFSNGGSGYIDMRPTPETIRDTKLYEQYNEKYGPAKNINQEGMTQTYVQQGGVLSNSQMEKVVGTEKAMGSSSVEDIYNNYAQGRSQDYTQEIERKKQLRDPGERHKWGKQPNATSVGPASYGVNRYIAPAAAPKAQLLPAVKRK